MKEKTQIHQFVVKIKSPTAISPNKAKKLLQQIIDCGWIDARDTAEENENDNKDAELVANFSITIKSTDQA